MGWLAGVPDFGALGGEARARLDALPVSAVARGTVLFRPGDAVRGYVIVLEGRVGVHLTGPTGREIRLYSVTPGSSCIQSTLGLLGGEDYSAEAVADEDTRLVLIPRTVFLELLGGDEAFRSIVFQAFARRMQTVMQVLETVAFARVEARLAAHMLSQADADGTVTATHQELAGAIGSAREVISRRLDAMARKGWIENARGVVHLRDRGALRRLADDAM